MPFISTHLYIDRGHMNTSKSENQLGEHSYRSETDTLAQVSAPGYFPAFFGDSSDNVFDHDTILIDATDGQQRYDILSVNPVEIVPLYINPNPYNQELNTFDSPSFEGLSLANLTQDDALVQVLVRAPLDDSLKWRHESTIVNNPFDQDLNTTNDVQFNSVTFPSVGAPSSSPMDFFSENQLVTLSFSGPFALPIDVDCVANRIGSKVTLGIPSFAGTAVNSSIVTATLPAWLSTSSIVEPHQPILIAKEGNVSTLVSFTVAESTLSLLRENSSDYSFLLTNDDLVFFGAILTYFV